MLASIGIIFLECRSMDPRQEFLIQMYKQLMADINRHIMVVWQSVGVLVSSFAVFALVENKILSLDIAASLIVLLCGWLYAHLLDAGYWYNRNLAMIANIERQFLNVNDLRNIHYYFGSHRPNNKMITHLTIQAALGIGLSILVLLLHFLNRVAPGLTAPIAHLELQRTLPYVFVVIVTIYVSLVKKQRDASYQEFLKNSPGIAIDTQGIEFGKGHGHRAGEGS